MANTITVSARLGFSPNAIVGYSVAPFYDQYVDVGDFVLSSNIGTYINTSSLYSDVKPITVLAYENIPVVTYVVTDGSPILLVSVFNTQYWSTS
jgi:hypothetical protein